MQHFPSGRINTLWCECVFVLADFSCFFAKHSSFVLQWQLKSCEVSVTTRHEVVFPWTPQAAWQKPLPSSLLLLLIFSPLLSLLFFQCRLVPSLCELDWELMPGKMKLFFTEFSFFFLFNWDTYFISLTGWMLIVLPWPLGDTARYWKWANGGRYSTFIWQQCQLVLARAAVALVILPFKHQAGLGLTGEVVMRNLTKKPTCSGTVRGYKKSVGKFDIVLAAACWSNRDW